MDFLSMFGSWASNTSGGGFALTVGLSIFALLVLFVGVLYWGLIKSSDVAKSLTRALVWVAVTGFLALMFFWASIWG